MRPSCPISAIASAGKRAARSHSAAKGRRRSAAKLRAMSRIITCSWDRIMTPSLPRYRLPVVMVEASAVGLAKTGDDAPHAGDALLGAERRAGAAHVGADPARA